MSRLGFHDYNHLQMNAFCVVCDSGTLPEEASFFTSVGHPFPAVCIRTSTERPEALDKGCFILAGISQRRRGAGGADGRGHERRTAMWAFRCPAMPRMYPPKW